MSGRGTRAWERRQARSSLARARGREEAKATRAARKLDPAYVSPAEIRRGQQRYEANEVRAAAHLKAQAKIGIVERLVRMLTNL